MGEYIKLWDFDGRLSMTIGNSCRVSHVPAENLLSTLKTPRTTMWDWNYRFCEGDKEQLYENILKDFRDILDLNGESVLLQHAKECRTTVPTRKQFHYLLEHYDELVNKYTVELAFRDESLVEKWEVIVKQIVALAGKPIEQVEEILLGYVAVMENEMLKEYGGAIKNNMRACTCYVLMDNGEVLFNFLADFFFIWKNGDEDKSQKRELMEFVLEKSS